MLIIGLSRLLINMLVLFILAIWMLTAAAQNGRNFCVENESGSFKCRWVGVGSYHLPPDATTVKFDRFYRPASLRIPENLTLLIFTFTDFGCSDFQDVPQRIFNDIICVSNVLILTAMI